MAEDETYKYEKIGRWEMLRNLPAILSTMRKMDPDEPRFAPPARKFKLPEYRQGMKYCRSKEPYLRPVRWCNPGNPHVVARAHDLGAYELSDLEYAEAAYWWIKNNMWWEMAGWYHAGETVRRGSGFCWQLNNAYAVLCRCAGIKTRFMDFKLEFDQYTAGIGVDPFMETALDIMGGALPESEVEVLIDGMWTPAYIPQTCSITAVSGLPISEFGESCLDLYYNAIPGSIRYYESVPFKHGLQSRTIRWFAPATQERLNFFFQSTETLGQTILDSMGGPEEYNRFARQKPKTMRREELIAAWGDELAEILARDDLAKTLAGE